MKGKFITIVIALILLLPITTKAEDEELWPYLNSIADQVLQMTKMEKYEEAKKMLDHFSSEFLTARHHESNISMNDLRVITISYEDAMEAVTATSLTNEERIRNVVQFRLAVDAMDSTHQPMWTLMEDTVMASFHYMKESINSDSFQQRLNQFLVKYETIYPSLVLDLEQDELQRLNSHITFLESYDSVSKEDKEQHIEVLKNDLYSLFKKVEKDETDPSLIWVMISTGSVILITLSYVGWRKYQAEKFKTKSRQKN